MRPSNRSSSEPSDFPKIPDYEILRPIGKGGYGEVFIGKSVTGTMRAVKVVRRANFESERAFEREFEGIQRYEQVSQEHSGLIDVLHVGRDDDQQLYYYVMELADDVENGRDIRVQTYVPQTLSQKLRQGEKVDLDETLELGKNLAEALGALHSHKLAHRDVKPSNIVYVRTRPRLADPGLVAASGQNTYVGTEGYVPPEGPGSAQADLYSLGMVLYEMNTGKDRMDFPELPTFVDPNEPNLKERRELNTIVCRTCAPRPKQRYPSANGLHDALNSVGTGHGPATLAVPWRGWGIAALAMLLAGGVFAGVMVGKRLNPGPKPAPAVEAPAAPESSPTSTPVAPTPEKIATAEDDPQPKPDESPPKPAPEEILPPKPPRDDAVADAGANSTATPPQADGELHVTSDPLGAIVCVDGQERGVTPIRFPLPAGEHLVSLKLEHHREIHFPATVAPGKTERVDRELAFWDPPRPGATWTNGFGMRFFPVSNESGHRTREAIRQPDFAKFSEASGLSAGYKIGNEQVVYATPEIRQAYCDWLTGQDRERGFLDENLRYMAELDEPLDGSPDLAAFAIFVGPPRFGEVHIDSQPQGAEVYLAGKKVGATPVKIPRHEVGPVRFEVRKDGHKGAELRGWLNHLEPLQLSATLEQNAGVQFGQNWTNHLEMSFVPLGEILCAIYETRRVDYEAYWLAEGGGERSFDVSYTPQGPDHPVVSIVIDEARAFCAWLTEVEREMELIQPDHLYRLPTDEEWSRMAGLTDEVGSSPEARDGRIKDIFPWGSAWPPPQNAGNFKDETVRRLSKTPQRWILEGYEDGFLKTAPVGKFLPNALGIFDLSGNVWEYVGDNYCNHGGKYSTVMRGGSWADYTRENLMTSTRVPTTADRKSDQCGFRVVLARAPSIVIRPASAD